MQDFAEKGHAENWEHNKQENKNGNYNDHSNGQCIVQDYPVEAARIIAIKVFDDNNIIHSSNISVHQ